ncbi:bifunctional diguanylate cyclase/phosphodiesterase [Agrilutibacter solisilvae]|uniref:EAL domain-containing protein n=1 Tax=Agrilutibacter solisilvae TaxID=2763317 RepID=A0A974Y095_9GAMM|nr:EAL domain-containing protein [Lysobacter solisilvae]QSX78075.1 EAL domain-containing protein [Lysobacter solisilvae]
MQQLMRFAIVTACYWVVAWSTFQIELASGGVASIWIANALVIGYAVHRPHVRLPWLLAAVVLAVTLNGVALQRRVDLAFLGGLTSAFEIYAVCAVIRRLGLRPGKPLADRDVFAFLVLCVLVVPAFAAAFGAWTRWLVTDVPWTRLWVDWWRADAFGMFVGLPLLWALDRTKLKRLTIGPQAPEFWSLATMTVLVVIASLVYARHPFVLISLPLLMVAVRTGVLGTALCNALMIASVLFVVDAHHRGYLPVLRAAGEGVALVDMWLSSCICAVGPLLVAFMSSQRNRERYRAIRAGERVRILTDAMPAFVAEIGKDLRYRFVNAKYQATYGLPPEAIIGKRPRDLLGDQVAEQIQPHLERALEGHPQRFDVTMGDGTLLEAVYEPLPSAGSVLVLGHDVTWRHEADRRFRNLLESAPDAMVVVDVPTRHIVLVNEQAERIFGVSRDAMLGEPIGRFIDDPERLAEAMAATHESDPDGRTWDVLAFQGRRPDGRGFPVEVVLSRLAGAASSQVVAGIRDVSRRQQAEDDLRREREQARVTLQSIGDAVLTYDIALAVTSLNRVAEDITGWSSTEAVGKPLEQIVRLYDSDEAGAEAVHIESRRGPGDDIYEADLLLRRPGQESLQVEVSDAPLRDDDGQVIGGVMVVRDISQTHAMAQRMAYLAQHDHLTGLPNSRLLQERLAEWLLSCEKAIEVCNGALLFVDLDLFKHINDSLGHHAGDWVLRKVADRLERAVGETDVVSRQGGDEFVLLLPRVAGQEQLERTAEQLIRTIEQPLQYGKRTLHVSASVGITVFPENGTDPKLLIKQADTALYHAKQAGRGRFSLYTAAMGERADQRLRLETELRTAIKEGQLFLEYQPKVRYPERDLVGMEALVRWHHPRGMDIPPGDFIPVAEETGLVMAIDEWVLREACRQVGAWHEAGLKPVPVAVNMSLARADVDRLVHNIERALADAHLPASLLEVEFTESQMLGQNVRSRQLVDRIRALGVRLAVDDFGTGYSSLSYLADFRFDTIKIDRAFVHGLPDENEGRAVIQAILGIAESLECSVVAEGVETEAQAGALSDMGCRNMQGFLFARPLSAGAFELELDRGRVGEGAAAVI